jgi:hypothetical protein
MKVTFDNGRCTHYNHEILGYNFHLVSPLRCIALGCFPSMTP